MFRSREQLRKGSGARNDTVLSGKHKELVLLTWAMGPERKEVQLLMKWGPAKAI